MTEDSFGESHKRRSYTYCDFKPGVVTYEQLKTVTQNLRARLIKKKKASGKAGF